MRTLGVAAQIFLATVSVLAAEEDTWGIELRQMFVPVQETEERLVEFYLKGSNVTLTGPTSSADRDLIAPGMYVGLKVMFGDPARATRAVGRSLPTISRRYEKKVSSLQLRLDKAREMKERGYRIRFRLDALAPISNWSSELSDIVRSINSIGPVRARSWR